MPSNFKVEHYAAFYAAPPETSDSKLCGGDDLPTYNLLKLNQYLNLPKETWWRLPFSVDHKAHIEVRMIERVASFRACC